MSFEVHRGTNVSHSPWMGESKARREERRAPFTRTDVQRLAGLGLDHLRIPIDEEQMWTERGQRENEAFDLLDAALDWCKEAGLRAVVDLHILRTHTFPAGEEPRLFTDPAEEGRFAGLWQDLSAHLKRRSNDLVAYELLNEPVAADPADWNRVARAAVEAVRRLEPERTIVLGSNRGNSAAAFWDLEPPQGDTHLVLAFHYYRPMLITHYRASWVPLGKYDGPVHYPGQPIGPHDWEKLPGDMRNLLAAENAFHNASVMERDLAAPLAVRKGTHLGLYCGEFGVIRSAPEAVRTAWLRDFRSVLAKHGIAWANWDYKGLFGLFDEKGRPTAVVEALLK
jgi:endoglucanase